MIDALKSTVDILTMGALVLSVIFIGVMLMGAMAAWARESMWSFMLFIGVLVVITAVL